MRGNNECWSRFKSLEVILDVDCMGEDAFTKIHYNSDVEGGKKRSKSCLKRMELVNKALIVKSLELRYLNVKKT